MASPLLQPGGQFGDYLIESVIGRGGMGVVYRAHDVHLDRAVALKLLAPELTQNSTVRSRFVRESRLAAAVDHPNVIPIYAAGDAGGHLYIAMRYVRGVDLRSELDRRQTLPLPEAMNVLRQTADALDAAHEAGLVHRDVKPANILLAEAPPGTRRHVYLTDFGLTKRSASQTGLTSAGSLIGTIDYMAPEQIRGEQVDRRTDVYALSCVAYAALVGHPPFRTEDDAAVLWAHMTVEPPPPSSLRPELPTTVDRALMAGLAKSPEDRPATCGALLDLMTEPEPAPDPDGPLPDAPDDSGDPPGGQRGRRPGKRALVAVAAAATVALALVIALAALPGEREWTTFTDPALSYSLEVPADWLPRTDGAGDSAVTVLSPADLSGLFADDPGALQAAADTADDDPEDVTGLAIYHHPRLDGSSTATVLSAATALLPGQDATLAPRGSTRAGDLDAQLMRGRFGLTGGGALQVRALSVESAPRQLLVFFAPPEVSTDQSDTFDRVAGSLRLTG